MSLRLHQPYQPRSSGASPVWLPLSTACAVLVADAGCAIQNVIGERADARLRNPLARLPGLIRRGTQRNGSAFRRLINRIAWEEHDALRTIQ